MEERTEQQQHGPASAAAERPKAKQHGLTAGIFGIYCSKRMDKVKKRGDCLYTPDEKTIRRHLAGCDCYPGTVPPNAMAVERELISSQNAIHSAIKRNPQLAADKISQIFPNDSTTTHSAHVCKNCGYSSKALREFRQHFGTKNNVYGCQLVRDASDGKIEVWTGICNIVCPKYFVDNAAKGIINIPTKPLRKNRKVQMPNRSNPNNSAANNVSIQQQQQQQQQQRPPSTTMTLSPMPFQPTLTTSSTKMQQAIDGSPTKKMKINDEARIDDALRCFVDPSSTNRGDASNKSFVKKHLILVTKMIDAMESTERSEQHFRELVSKTSTLQLQGDHAALRPIELAGRLWLTTNNANLDVGRIIQGHRGRLFQVSEPEAPDAETMVKGKTFVPSLNVDKIVGVWSHFIHFIIRHNPKLIEYQLHEAQDIYFQKVASHDKETDAMKVAAAEIVNTNIIFGIVLAAVHERPTTANGLNSMDYFLKKK